MGRTARGAMVAGALTVVASAWTPQTMRGQEPSRWFAASAECMACHNHLFGPGGEDLSIGLQWRGTMMAQSSRDPYWQASVRREVTDHPNHQADIEQECSTCHMPMAHYGARLAGGKARVFAHLPTGGGDDPDGLAADGVSCTVCHQILPDGLGTPATFVGRFRVDPDTPPGRRMVFGPYFVDEGRTTVMRTSSLFEPQEGAHIRDSALCATCHTLYTHALAPGAEGMAAFPEQVPFLEWRHGGYREERGCPSCHMEAVEAPVAIASVLGQPREGVRGHDFRGGNFLVPRLLNRLRASLGTLAEPGELEGAALRALAHLREETARIAIEEVCLDETSLQATVRVDNLAGHKLPTAYPSRRAWLHVTVREVSSGRILFESGRLLPDGSIEQNDNDLSPDAFEAHYQVIESPEQVQIYEAILLDPQGRVTTGLLQAVRYGKDNRLLPRGFDKASAPDDVAVHGEAVEDLDFVGGGDTVTYRVVVGKTTGPLEIHAALRFQPIGYRWAQNLEALKTPEPRRFVSAFRDVAAGSSAVLAEDRVLVGAP